MCLYARLIFYWESVMIQQSKLATNSSYAFPVVVKRSDGFLFLVLEILVWSA